MDSEIIEGEVEETAGGFFSDIWDDIVSFFTGNAWTILWFIVVLVFGFILVKLIMRFLRKILDHTKMEGITKRFVEGSVRLILYVVLVLILLMIIGVEISGAVTAISAIILAIGLALEDCISNVAGGLVVISNHLFKEGDYIKVGDKEGFITNISFLFTTINTIDNRRVTIPNTSMMNNSVENFGANPQRRIEVFFSVAYESDVELVKKVVTDVMESDGRVLNTPDPPFCRLNEMGASALIFRARCWCDNEDYWDVYYYVMENVYNEFKRNGITVPFTQIEMRERTEKVKMPVIGDGLPKRVEKVRAEQTHRFNLESDDFSLLMSKLRTDENGENSGKGKKGGKKGSKDKKGKAGAKGVRAGAAKGATKKTGTGRTDTKRTGTDAKNGSAKSGTPAKKNGGKKLTLDKEMTTGKKNTKNSRGTEDMPDDAKKTGTGSSDTGRAGATTKNGAAAKKNGGKKLTLNNGQITKRQKTGNPRDTADMPDGAKKTESGGKSAGKTTVSGKKLTLKNGQLVKNTASKATGAAKTSAGKTRTSSAQPGSADSAADRPSDGKKTGMADGTRTKAGGEKGKGTANENKAKGGNSDGKN